MVSQNFKKFKYFIFNILIFYFLSLLSFQNYTCFIECEEKLDILKNYSPNIVISSTNEIITSMVFMHYECND